MTRLRLLLVGLTPLLSFGATDCIAPPAAVAKLKAYLSYESSVGVGSPGPRRFSFAAADGDSFFLQYKVPQYYDPTQRPIYVARKRGPVMATSCPANPQWPKCVQKQLQDLDRVSQNLVESSISPTCDISVNIPIWHPSPDSPLKRRLASELLDELTKFGYKNPKDVYVRNFNVNDPEVDFYVIYPDGEQELQGCFFDAARQPHCQWHLFGQSPIKELKRMIMARPYRLFPPQADHAK